MRKRHSVLVLNIETFAEEDEAYELLNSLSMSLPFVVMITRLLDALLASVYLTEVSSPWFEFQLLNSLPLKNQNNGSLEWMMKKE